MRTYPDHYCSIRLNVMSGDTLLVKRACEKMTILASRCKAFGAQNFNDEIYIYKMVVESSECCNSMAFSLFHLFFLVNLVPKIL